MPVPRGKTMTASQHFETVIKVRDGTGMTEKNSPDTAEPVLCILHKRRLNLRR